MNSYRCNVCKKVVKRDSTKLWIKSVCASGGTCGWSRLYRLAPNAARLWKRNDAAIAKKFNAVAF